MKGRAGVARSVRRLAAVAILVGGGSTLGLGPAVAPVEDAGPLVIKMRPPLWRNPEVAVPKDDYKTQLIDLILERTVATDGPFRIELIPTTIQSRIFQLMEDDEVNVVVTMTSREREERLLPVRIPVYKGLYGWRLLVIRRADQARFQGIETLEQLGALWAGQGRDWPDTAILEANGLRVDTAVRAGALYRMLIAGRIDYYPRGVHEPYLELAEEGERARSLTVEDHLALHYPAPGYIFVARHNRALAERLERGLRAALADGSFDRFFRGHPDIRTSLRRAGLEARTVLRLENPLLTPQTPLERRDLWFWPGQDSTRIPEGSRPR